MESMYICLSLRTRGSGTNIPYYGPLLDPFQTPFGPLNPCILVKGVQSQILPKYQISRVLNDTCIMTYDPRCQDLTSSIQMESHYLLLSGIYLCTRAITNYIPLYSSLQSNTQNPIILQISSRSHESRNLNITNLRSGISLPPSRCILLSILQQYIPVYKGSHCMYTTVFILTEQYTRIPVSKDLEQIYRTLDLRI